MCTRGHGLRRFGTRYLWSSPSPIKTFLLLKHFPFPPAPVPRTPAQCCYTQREQSVDCVTRWPFCEHWCGGSALHTGTWVPHFWRLSGAAVAQRSRASDRNIGSCQRTVRSVGLKRSAVLGFSRFGKELFFPKFDSWRTQTLEAVITTHPELAIYMVECRCFCWMKMTTCPSLIHNQTQWLWGNVINVDRLRW